MKHLYKLAKNFARREEGLETVEYALMAALLLLTLVTALATMGGALSDAFGRATDAL